MKTSRMAVALGTMLMAAPAAAGVLDGSQAPMKAVEKVGPAAAGDPKPYWARATAECSGAACEVNFGKKGKIRKIRWINCGFAVGNGVVRVGVVGFNDLNDQRGYFSTVSSVMQVADETAVIEYKNPIDVPAGERLYVYIAATGTPAGGQCTLGGTIE